MTQNDHNNSLSKTCNHDIAVQTNIDLIMIYMEETKWEKYVCKMVKNL